MLAADVIFFASPVYFYSVSDQLKALFDRSVVYYPNITGKQYYFLMTMGDENKAMAEGTIKGTKYLTAAYRLGLKVK